MQDIKDNRKEEYKVEFIKMISSFYDNIVNSNIMVSRRERPIFQRDTFNELNHTKPIENLETKEDLDRLIFDLILTSEKFQQFKKYILKNEKFYNSFIYFETFGCKVNLYDEKKFRNLAQI